MVKRRKDSLASFEGIYGDRQARPDKEYLFAELIGERTARFNGEIAPHAHPGVMQVFLIEEGIFNFQESSQGKKFAAPVLLVIPSTVLHGFLFNENIKGRIVTLSEIRFGALWAAAPNLISIADQLIVIREFTDYPVEQFSRIMATIQEEQSRNDAEQEIMLTACLQQLFLMINRSKPQETGPQSDTVNSANNYVRKVQHLIKESHGKITVAALAAALHISATHLNRVCRQVTDRSVSGLINDYLIREAKKYLNYTNMTVAEIAYLLEFEYPNYFARFFKQHTGVTPQVFRNSAPGK